MRKKSLLFFRGKKRGKQSLTEQTETGARRGTTGSTCAAQSDLGQPLAEMEANEYEAQREARITKNYEKLRDLVNDSLQRTIETVYAAENEGKENANARR